MRDIRRLAWFSVSGPRVRASRQSARAMTSMRGRGCTGLGPAWVAMSSSDRPEPTASSKVLAWLFRALNRMALSMITAQDHSEAIARPIMIACTTMSASMNRETGLIIEAWAAVVIQASFRLAVHCAPDGRGGCVAV